MHVCVCVCVCVCGEGGGTDDNCATERQVVIVQLRDR